MKLRYSLRIVGLVGALFASNIQAEKVETPALSGEQLARTYCTMCHSFTEPDLLPKHSWNFLLTYMGLKMGIDDISYLDQDSAIDMDIIQARRELLDMSNLKPGAPMLNDADWKSLRDYFMDNAPTEYLPQLPKPVIEEGLSLFEPKAHRHSPKAALTSLVHIDEEHQQLLIGDSSSQTFTILNEDLRFVVDYKTRNSMWVQAEMTEKGVYLLSIGDVAGSKIGQKVGKLFYGKRLGNQYLTKGAALSGLYRPSAMAFGDLNQDGVDEIVISNFGIDTGDVSIYSKSGDGYEYDDAPAKILTEAAGAVDCEVYDFNGDGLLDIVALVSDAREKLSLYLNKGDFVFEEKVIVEPHASFGYVSVRLLDFNKDGIMDLVTINGDNWDADPYNTPKRFHGLRIYLGDGDLNFKETYFYPMFGMYGAEIEDFDQDGDYDIAGIAFLPDFTSEKPEGFVYLEQTSPFEFKAKSHPSTETGRWLTIDSGDLDQDGDIDIVLGAGYVPLGVAANNPERFQEMMESGPAMLFLDNQLK